MLLFLPPQEKSNRTELKAVGGDGRGEILGCKTTKLADSKRNAELQWYLWQVLFYEEGI